jgi:hypothetical protein
MTDVTFDVGSPDHQLLAGDTEAALIEGSRQDPNTFLEYVLQDEETGRHIIQAPLHEEWQNLMTRHDRLVIWSATESGKSQQTSIGRVLWELGRNPNLRIAIVSNTYEQAGKIVRSISKYIEQSEELHAAFPDLKPDEPWTGTQLFVKRKVRSKDPSVQAFGVHGNILGARIDVLILDDVLDYENCRTPALRADLWDWYHATLAGRLTSRARVWVIGTAFSPEDMLHRFAVNPIWHAIRCPILDPSTSVSRWPERWPPVRIEKRRQELGPLEFARQMLCMARDDSQSRFRRDWIDTCLIRGHGHTLVDRLDVVPSGYRVVAGVDLAVKRTAAADMSCIFTLGVHPNGSREVLMIEAGRWSGPDIVSRIVDNHRRYHSIVYVEDNAAQDFIIQFAREASAVPVKPFNTGRNKMSPEFGVESLAAEMAGGKWIIPCRLDGTMHPEVAAWVQEMLYYDPAGHTGDRLMASWIAREGARKGRSKVQWGRIDLSSR